LQRNYTNLKVMLWDNYAVWKELCRQQPCS